MCHLGIVSILLFLVLLIFLTHILFLNVLNENKIRQTYIKLSPNLLVVKNLFNILRLLKIILIDGH